MADHSDLGFTPAAPAANAHADLGFTPAGGGTTGPNVAYGTSDDAIMRSFGLNDSQISQVKASPRYQANVKENGSGLSFVLNKPGEKADLLDRIAYGAGTTGILGPLQLARHVLHSVGLVSDQDQAYSDLLTRVIQENYKQNLRGGQKEGVPELAGSAIVPVPGGSLIKGEGMLANVGRGVVTGATAATMQPVDNPQDGFAGQKLRQAGTGAVVGGGTGAVVTGGGKLIGKAVNAYQGNIPKEAADVMEQGKRFGVRVLPGDVTGNPAQQKAEVLLESVPVVGTGSERAAQQTEAKAAAEKLQSKFEDRLIEAEPEGYQDVLDAAANGDQRARNLVEKLHNAGNDPDKTLQASIGLADFRTRQQAKSLYDDVQDLVEQAGLGNIDLQGTANALKRTIAQSRLSKLPNKEVLGVLEEMQRNLSASNGGKVNNGYGAMRQTLSDLDERIRGLMQGENALIGEKGIAQLEQVRNAIEGDMQAFVKKSGNPDIIAAQDAADQYYRTARVPFKDGMLAQAAVTTEPDQIYQQFIKAGKGDRAQKFYQALDNRGQAAVRYSMIADALNKATDPAKGVFSPQKFFTSLDKLDDAYGVFFKGSDKWEVDGFKNLMQHITRAGQFAENPPTGNRLVPLMWAGLTGGAAYAAHTAGMLPELGGAAGLLSLAKPLMMSDTGKRFLVAASSLKPGSPAMAALVQKMAEELPQLAAKGATQPADRPPLSSFEGK